jgi:hypothetical protein
MATAAIPFILSGLSALSGFFSGKPKQTTSTTDQSGNTSSNSYQTGGSTSTTTPNLSPEQLQLLQSLIGRQTQLANQDQDLSGYKAGGMQQINQGADAQSKIVQNILASRGLSYSPTAATSLAGVQSNRIQQQNQFANGIPLLQRQLKTEDIGKLLDIFKSIPYGSTTTGSNTESSNSSGYTSGSSKTVGTSPDQSLAGLFSGLGQGVASTYGYNSQMAALAKALGVH